MHYGGLAAFAPEYKSDMVFDESFRLSALPYAKTEAAAITKLMKGDLYEGEKAAKKTFLEGKKKYDFYHLAMHALMYEDDFAQSCLIFANQEKLYFSELYALHISAQLVVLSACNTGDGKLLNGEGVMSLSRAFTYAGVSSTVVS